MDGCQRPVRLFAAVEQMLAADWAYDGCIANHTAKTAMNPFEQIRADIIADSDNKALTQQGWLPLYHASATAKIAVIGQAPGRKAQEAGIAWHDASGERLRRWLGVTDVQFYDDALFALLPMDFYFPGMGKHGDLPPRADFAPKWHTRLFAHMPDIELVLLVGSYAQQHYLVGNPYRTLTDTVEHYVQFLPRFWPLVHPSPRNFRWHARNPWFEAAVVPQLQTHVRHIIQP